MTDCISERLLWIHVIQDAYSEAQRGSGTAKAFFFSERFLQVATLMFEPDQVRQMQSKALQCQRKERVYKKRIKPIPSGWVTGVNACF